MKITRIIETKTIKTQYGDKPKMTVEIEGGKTVDYWGNDLKEGQEVNGEIIAAKDPKYNATLKVVKDNTKTASFASKTASVEKAMQRKEVSIEAAQGRKNDAIILAAAQRDAVMIVNTIYEKEQLVPIQSAYSPEDTETVIKNSIKKWRDWFISLNDNTSQPPF